MSISDGHKDEPHPLYAGTEKFMFENLCKTTQNFRQQLFSMDLLMRNPPWKSF